MINCLQTPATQHALQITGLPDVAQGKRAVFCGRLQRQLEEFMRDTGIRSLDLRVSCGPASTKAVCPHSNGSGARVAQFSPVEPHAGNRDWVIPASTRAEIEILKLLISEQEFLQMEWGLDIRPAVVFSGPPGTGKTMGAHMLARELGKEIIVASYTALESKYPGEGAAKVRGLFHAAATSGAVLLLDESENAFGRRLSVTHGSEQAINSIKNELLLCLGQHTGLVICATNKVVEFDKAFLSRMQAVVQFSLPDQSCREMLWNTHLKRVTKADDIMWEQLGQRSDGFAGRDIRNTCAVAGGFARKEGRFVMKQCDLIAAIELISSRDLIRVATPLKTPVHITQA